jgi:hypothetical protein
MASAPATTAHGRFVKRLALASLRDSAMCNLCSQAQDLIWRWPLPIEIMTELETALAIEDRCTPNFVL